MSLFTRWRKALLTRWRKSHVSRSRKLIIALGVLVIVLVAARLALPYWALDRLNERMQVMGEYRGRVADLDIHLWRGAYSLTDVVIEKASGKVPVPLLKAPHTDIAISWKALFHGHIVARVHFERPHLTLVDGRSRQDTQTGRGVDWRSQLERLLPTRLDDLRISDGIVTFRNFFSRPQVDLHATQVEATVENLTNSSGELSKRPALLRAKANVLNGAPLAVQSRFDPFGGFDNFDFDLTVQRIKLTELNELFQAYALLDVESGAGEFVVQMVARDGRVRGYAKPLFRDIKLINWKEDAKNPLKLVWEMIAGTLIAIFKNHELDQFGTRINFEGPIKGPDIDTMDAIIGILRNAFVEALRPGFEKIKKDEPKPKPKPSSTPQSSKKLPERVEMR